MKSKSSLQPISISIVLNLSPFGHGGLAAYGRTIAKILQDTGKFSVKVAHLNYGAPNSQPNDSFLSTSAFCPIELQPFARLLYRHVFPRLASRVIFNPLLELLAEKFVTLPVNRHAEPSGIVHFIGTGWDFTGFAFLKVARSWGAKFTVWPAVHPGSWGDDKIDIRLYSQANSVFCQSDSEKKHLIRLGVSEHILIRCGLPPMNPKTGDRQRMRQQLEIENRPAVLFLGRRDEGKGYPALLRAWNRVLEKVPDAVLLIAGPGDPMHTLIDRLPVDSVRDLAVPDETAKADAYAACDVFCLPSAHESFGLVYVEAWSYGKPVICGTAPACRELVENGKTGIHSTQDPAELAQAIIHLLGQPEEALKIGAAGRMHQRQNFTEQNMVATHLKAWA